MQELTYIQKLERQIEELRNEVRFLADRVNILEGKAPEILKPFPPFEVSHQSAQAILKSHLVAAGLCPHPELDSYELFEQVELPRFPKTKVSRQ